MKHLIAALLLLTASAEARESPAPPLALTHLTVIDTAGGPSLPDMTVVIRDGHIASVGKSDAPSLPRTRA